MLLETALPANDPDDVSANTVPNDRDASTPDPDIAPDAFRNLRHDLRTPINHVIGYSELLLEEATDIGLTSVMDDLERIRGAGRELLVVVNEQLDLSKSGARTGDLDQLSHELRTPLNAIIGCSELLQEEVRDLEQEAFLPDLQRIYGTGRQLLSMVNAVLDLARADGVGFAPEDDHTAPATRGTSEPLAKHDPPSGDVPGRLLVVDDNETNRDMLSRRLARLGYTVAVAGDGQIALRMLSAEAFDLVLPDIMMPIMNGYEVLEYIKADERLRTMPVIVLSASDETDSAVTCIGLGAEDYLPKPFDPVLLRARINASLEKKRLRDQEASHLQQIEEERQRSDDLLHVILPDVIVQELKDTDGVKPRRYDNVAVMFCDIVGFTDYCDKREPHEVMPSLQRLVEQFEDIADRNALEKIKTIGDSFMAAAGLLNPIHNPVLSCVRAGVEIIAAAQALPEGWNVRVGMNIGPVIAGVLGHRQYLFDLFGDTVNTAARMESNGQPGFITLSSSAWSSISEYCRGASLGKVEVKGKGLLEIFQFGEFVDAAPLHNQRNGGK